MKDGLEETYAWIETEMLVANQYAMPNGIFHQ